MSDKPVLIFVHGTSHGPECFTDVSNALQRAGFTCVDDLQLPGSGGTRETVLGDDIKAIRDTILKVIEEKGRDCIIISHSYGAIPSSEAIKGLLKADRNGKSCVVKMIYLAPNLPMEGESWYTDLSSRFGQVGKEMPAVMDMQDGMFVWVGTDNDFLYNGISPDVQKLLMKKLKKQSPGCLMTPLNYAGWQHVPCWFLLGKQDNAIIPEYSELIVAQPGLKDPVVEWIDAGHTMFISHVEETVDFIIRAAKS